MTLGTRVDNSCMIGPNLNLKFPQLSSITVRLKIKNKKRRVSTSTPFTKATKIKLLVQQSKVHKETIVEIGISLYTYRDLSHQVQKKNLKISSRK